MFSLSDEQELDWKRQMMSSAAVQRIQTVSHKQQATLNSQLLKDVSKHQKNLRRKLHLTVK